MTFFEDMTNLIALISGPATNSLVSSLTGTFVGAVSAYLLTARNENEKLKLQEDTAITRAFQAATSIMNSVLNFKEQIVLPKVKELAHLTETVESKFAEPGTRPVIIPLDIHQLLLSHPVLNLAAHRIDFKIQNVYSIVGRPVQCADEVRRSSEMLDSIINSMNLLIEDFSKSELADEDRIFLMLGLMQGKENRKTDERFRSTIDNLRKVTDDILFFAHLLAQDLEHHQTAWRKRNHLRKRSRLRLADLGDKAALLPNLKEYESWLKQPLASID